MIKLLGIEFFKLKRSSIWLVITLLPLLSVIWGVCFVFIFRAVPANIKEEFLKVFPGGSDTWYILFSGSTSLYMPLMLPILAAVIMAWISRIEHQNNVWKSTLALPVKKSSLFLCKFVTGITLMFISILSLSVFLLLAGTILGGSYPVPVSLLLLKPVLGGVTALPIVVIYTIISIWFSNAAIPIAMGGVLSLPVSMIVNSDKLWLIYPWSYPARFTLGNFNGQENLLVLMFVISILGALSFLLIGLYSFNKRDVL